MKKGNILKSVEWFSIAIFFVLVMLVMLQVYFRYVAKISVPWTEEVARLLYIWMVFIGIVIVEAENGTVRTTYFLDKMPKKVGDGIKVIENSLTIIFLMILTYGSFKMMTDSWVRSLGSLTWISSGVLYIPAVIGPFIAIFYLVKRIVKAEKIDVNKGVE